MLLLFHSAAMKARILDTSRSIRRDSPRICRCHSLALHKHGFDAIDAMKWSTKHVPTGRIQVRWFIKTKLTKLNFSYFSHLSIKCSAWASVTPQGTFSLTVSSFDLPFPMLPGLSCQDVSRRVVNMQGQQQITAVRNWGHTEYRWRTKSPLLKSAESN